MAHGKYESHSLSYLHAIPALAAASTLAHLGYLVPSTLPNILTIVPIVIRVRHLSSYSRGILCDRNVYRLWVASAEEIPTANMICCDSLIHPVSSIT